MKKQFILLLSLIIILSGCSSVAIMPENVVSQSLNDNKILTGKMYSASTQVNVTAGQTVYLKALSTQTTHLIERFVYAVTDGQQLEYEIRIFEGGTNTASTNITSFNVNRNFIENSSLRISKNVIGIDLSGAVEIPFGSKLVSDKKASSDLRFDIEYVIKPETNYYMAVTNNDGGTMSITFWWEWYSLE